MKFKIIIASIIIFSLVIAAAVLIMKNNRSVSEDEWFIMDNDEYLGTLSQEIIFNYQDGSSSVDTFWLYNNEKIIESIDYFLYATPTKKIPVETSGIDLLFTVKDSTGKTLFSDEELKSTLFKKNTYVNEWDKTMIANSSINPFHLVNYNLDDDIYTIDLHFSGDLKAKGMVTNLPDPLSFEITVKDERWIDINFG
jgi:hypothetical protein